MRRHISAKPHTHTESAVVYAAGMSVKVDVHYPGGLSICHVLLRREAAGWIEGSQQTP
ncbi:MAG: hypothetical protein GX162_13110 [Firmicutes bacterium]|nr:hypothetical protein [Bacillota bacterium]